MIITSSSFSCNGRVTGYLISLQLNNSSESGYPSVQIWHPTSSTEYTRVDTDCTLTASDISMMMDENGNDYYLGNVSCAGNNTIEFQSGDVFGYHQSRAVRYQLWSIGSNGYTSYYRNTNIPLNTFTISNDVQSVSNRQPLIEVMYGKINILT